MTTLDRAPEVLPALMTREEAEEAIAGIRRTAGALRSRLVEFQSRRGYAALGYTDEQLVNGALNAAARAGVSNSGICFDPAAVVEWDRMNGYRLELLRRLTELRASQDVSNR